MPSLFLVATTGWDDSEMFCEVVRMTSTGGGERAAEASTGKNLVEDSVLITPVLLTRASCITAAVWTKYKLNAQKH